MGFAHTACAHYPACFRAKTSLWKAIVDLSLPAFPNFFPMHSLLSVPQILLISLPVLPGQSLSLLLRLLQEPVSSPPVADQWLIASYLLPLQFSIHRSNPLRIRETDGPLSRPRNVPDVPSPCSLLYHSSPPPSPQEQRSIFLAGVSLNFFPSWIERFPSIDCPDNSREEGVAIFSTAVLLLWLLQQPSPEERPGKALPIVWLQPAAHWAAKGGRATWCFFKMCSCTCIHRNKSAFWSGCSTTAKAFARNNQESWLIQIEKLLKKHKVTWLGVGVCSPNQWENHQGV